MIKIALWIAVFVCAFAYKSTSQDAPPPPLHTLKTEDIKEVNPSFENETINVIMNSGVVYVYGIADWDLEDRYPSLDSRIKGAIRNVQKTFTKVEQPPVFPGGQEAWDKFVAAFCEQHKRTIRKEGSSTVYVQFIVHVKGQLTDIQVISNPGQSTLGKDIIEAIKGSAPWEAAVQNGRKVIAYCIQPVKLSR
jgi:hypothetical protein